MSKLVRMRESLSMPNSFYKEITAEASSVLKESANKVHSNKLNESSNNEIIKEATKLRESVENKELFDKIINKLKEEGASSDRKLWKFPVSRFGNKNGNGRIYPRELWENVINNQRDVWCGGCGLADHPMDDADPGQFKTSSIVWLDMMIDDANKLIWAIGTFVGTYGKLAQEIIEAGGRIGFSSSGFGETELDGCTINPDTYQIERVADIVTNPSQCVFGDISSENIQASPLDNKNIEYSKQTVKNEDEAEKPIISSSVNPVAVVVEESNDKKANLNEGVEIIPKSEIIKNNNSISADAVTENEKTSEEKAETNETKVKESISKLEMKAIEKYVEGLQNKAKELKSPKARYDEVSEILSMVENCGNENLKNKVENQLKAEKENLQKIINSALELHEDVGDLNLFADSAKKVAMEGQILSKQVQDYKLLSEGLSKRLQTLVNENNVLKSKLALHESSAKKAEINANKNSVADAVKIDELTKKAESLSKNLDTAKHVIKVLSKKSLKMTENIKDSKATFTNKFEEMKKEIVNLATEIDKLTTIKNNVIKESNTRNARAKANINHLESKIKELISINEALNKGNKKLEAKNGVLESKIKELNESITAKTTEVAKLNETVDALKKESESLDKTVKIYEAKKAEEDSYKPAVYTKKAGLSFREDSKLESYWADLKEAYGSAIDPYEKRIRFAKTYQEAVSNFLKIRTDIDESARMAEAANVSYGITNKDQRKQLLEEAGMTFEKSSEMSIDEINAIETENLKKMGLR